MNLDGSFETMEEKHLVNNYYIFSDTKYMSLGSYPKVLISPYDFTLQNLHVNTVVVGQSHVLTVII